MSIIYNSSSNADNNLLMKVTATNMILCLKHNLSTSNLFFSIQLSSYCQWLGSIDRLQLVRLVVHLQDHHPQPGSPSSPAASPCGISPLSPPDLLPHLLQFLTHSNINDIKLIFQVCRPWIQQFQASSSSSIPHPTWIPVMLELWSGSPSCATWATLPSSSSDQSGHVHKSSLSNSCSNEAVLWNISDLSKSESLQLKNHPRDILLENLWKPFHLNPM